MYLHIISDYAHSAAGNRIPSLTSLVPSRSRRQAAFLAYPPLLTNLLTNPYALTPVLFAFTVLFIAVSVPLCVFPVAHPVPFKANSLISDDTTGCWISF